MRNGLKNASDTSIAPSNHLHFPAMIATFIVPIKYLRKYFTVYMYIYITLKIFLNFHV